MRIGQRFNGPPGSGNGGFSAGVFAVAGGAAVGGPTIEVTLRTPPPLDTELTFADGTVRDPAGGLVAEVVEAAGVAEVVPGVPAEAAEAAAPGYAGFADHPFPGCYVCGPDRADGLRIFPGPIGPGRTAAPWTVPEDMDLAVLWAALDCPGGWTVIGTGRVYVLGRLAVTAHALPTPGTTCVVVGEGAAGTGRTAPVRSTVYAPDGSVLATARATWVMIGG